MLVNTTCAIAKRNSTPLTDVNQRSGFQPSPPKPLLLPGTMIRRVISQTIFPSGRRLQIVNLLTQQTLKKHFEKKMSNITFLD